MIINKLYRYNRARGGITVSLNKPNCEYTELVRLMADEGKRLTKNGEKLYSVIDQETAEGWYEIDDPNKLENEKSETPEEETSGSVTENSPEVASDEPAESTTNELTQ